jgi:hypothetical protein
MVLPKAAVPLPGERRWPPLFAALPAPWPHFPAPSAVSICRYSNSGHTFFRVGLRPPQAGKNVSSHYIALIETCNKYPKPEMLERLATALEVKPHELFYMPSIAENALVRLQETVSANIEQIVADAIEKTLAESIKTNRLC